MDTLTHNPVYLSPRAMKQKVWGQLLSLNLSQCDLKPLTSPKLLRAFFPALCKKIKMVPYGKPMLQRFGNGYLEGYSALQFIETSSITVHCDEVDGRAFVDIFSCKTFSVEAAKKFCQQYFKAKKITHLNFYRT